MQSSNFTFGVTIAICVAYVILSQAHASGTGGAATPWVKAGTLTCTATAIKGSKKNLVRDISCRYQPIGRAAATFTGSIRRYGRNVHNNAKHHLIWNVFGPTPDIAPQSISGIYRSSIAPGKRGGKSTFVGLIGGWNNSIGLKPVPPKEKFSLTNVATSVLEIELVAVRV